MAGERCGGGGGRGSANAQELLQLNYIHFTGP